MGSISTRENDLFIKIYIFYFCSARQSATLNSATQQAMPPDSGGKSRMECLRTRFPLPLIFFCFTIRRRTKPSIKTSPLHAYLSRHCTLISGTHVTFCLGTTGRATVPSKKCINKILPQMMFESTIIGSYLILVW